MLLINSIIKNPAIQNIMKAYFILFFFIFFVYFLFCMLKQKMPLQQLKTTINLLLSVDISHTYSIKGCKIKSAHYIFILYLLKGWYLNKRQLFWSWLVYAQMCSSCEIKTADLVKEHFTSWIIRRRLHWLRSAWKGL